MRYSKDLLLNLPSVPDKTSVEYDAFWDNERKKAEYGVTIDGVYITGWLYWHTQLWNIYIDQQDTINHTIKRVFKHPDFRDNEWIIANALERAQKEKKGVMFFGSRRLGKSEFASSYIGRHATLFQGTENVIAGGNWGDVDVITYKLTQGLNALPEYFKFGRLAENLRKEIELGFKDKKGTRLSWSKIMMRNHEDGFNTEAVAGITASSFVMDEVGKALKNDSILYGENGIYTIGEAKVGDKIYGADGKLATITHVFPQPIKDLYSVKLDDGREVVCCLEHLWEIYDSRIKKDIIVDTKYLLDNLLSKTGKYKGRFFIRRNKPLEYSKKHLKIDPYLLGVWLGDGSKNSTSFTSIDNEIVENVKKIIPKGLYVKSEINGDGHNIINIKHSNINILREYLRYYKIFSDKRIPKDYLESSFEDRLALLQGLMDTDGECLQKGGISFTQVKEDLSKDIEFLIRSLGIRMKKRKAFGKYKNKEGKIITCQPTNTFTLFTDLPVFRLSRKRNRQKLHLDCKKHRSYVEKSKIISIDYHSKDYSTCIRIDNTDKLFLTNDFIVTHNSQFSQVFEGAKPAFTSPFGWRCVPILTGTSGDIKKSSDAEKFFMNPEAYNFIAVELPEEGNIKTGVFISGLRRMEGKYKTTLADYVQTENGILIPQNSELTKVEFYNSDFTKAEAVIDDERLQASKSPDATALLKATMYYPKNTKELFLVDDGNNFPAEAIQEHLAYLQANPELQGQVVNLYRDTANKVKVSFNTNKKPITDFPLKLDDKTSKDAPVVIYEMPIENPPAYLYISGADPYNQSNSKWSSSLGSCYIYKRTYDPINGSFERRIVASYTARPESLKQWHETVELLLELYNAVCLPENEAATFIQYFDSKNKSHVLADGYNFLKEISPSTSITGRVKGLPATTKVQKYYKELVYQYCMEEVTISMDKEGNQIKKLGITRIADIALLKELAAFTEKGNYDRYVAFGHTLAHEVWADKIYPYAQQPSQQKEKDQQNKHIKQFNPFKMGLKTNNPFFIKR